MSSCRRPDVLDRYSRPEMRAIWSDDGRYRRWLDVEIAVCEEQALRGTIPREAVVAIREKARVDPARVAAIEREVHHDVIAFLTSVTESVGPGPEPKSNPCFPGPRRSCMGRKSLLRNRLYS